VRDPGPARSNDKASALAVWSWVRYDFSNAIFPVSIPSYSRPLWLREELGARISLFNYVSAASAFIIAFTVPFLGAFTDLWQRRRSHLIILTVLAVAATEALDLAGSVLVGVALFIAADVTYHSAIIFIMILGISFLSRVPDARPDITVDGHAPLVQGERTGTV
jgi:MFS transporter, UMF1 family